ncbi:ATP synthase beta subunit C-terminal domain-containing protein [Falsibacillus pallidus]|uniref:ATP synthase beta subunit C-terminal domain-containing protein n=1 Tax=Falsibacillus pallidus TaxID=493781 RepID=UPI003D9715E8
MENLRLNVALLRRRVPNLTSAAKSVGLRPATVSNLCTGKIPVGRSEVKTLVALADLAECTLDELIIRGEKVEMIETKIKALDLFAPVAKGGTIGLVARPGMGQLVILLELFHRLKGEGYKAVFLMPEGNYPELDDVKDFADVIATSIDQAYEELAQLGKDNDVLFAADRSNVVSGEIYDLQDRLQAIGVDSITTFLLDLTGQAVDEDLPYGPLETLLQFDADLTARHLFPAINPIQSTSSVLEGAFLDQNHLLLQQRAQKLLRRYRELRSLVQVSGMDRLPASEIQTYKRGERLEAYLTQPFYTAEAFTGQKGESVSIQETLEDVRKIIDGAADAKELDELQYIGKLN